MKLTRVLIADDHDVVRLGVKGLLEGSSKFEVCGEARNGREAVEAAAALKPDIVVMDIGMPELNGLEAARQILHGQPEIQILILTMHESEQIVREVLNVGARGYVLKADAGRDLVAGLDALAEGKPFFTSKVADLVLQGYLNRGPATDGLKAPGPSLSPREREIVQLVAEGKSNKEVASILHISVKTAETHRAHIMTKLELHSVSDLVKYAIRNHIIEI